MMEGIAVRDRTTVGNGAREKQIYQPGAKLDDLHTVRIC